MVVVDVVVLVVGAGRMMVVAGAVWRGVVVVSRLLFLNRLRRRRLRRFNFCLRGEGGRGDVSVCGVVWFRLRGGKRLSMIIGPLSLPKSVPLAGSRLIEEESSKNLEREAGGGVCAFGAWYLSQYFSAKARLCLSV